MTTALAPRRMAVEMHSPVADSLANYIAANRFTAPCVTLQPDTCQGRTLALCGAGPSLAKHVIEGVDDVWACNSALPYLTGKGVRVTAGVGIDQTPGLLREWASAPDVPYYLASSVDPALVAHLRAHGRRVAFFHNAVGLADEFDTYCRTWPPTFMVGQGSTVVSRVLGLAFWLGYERVDVYGEDCCLAPGDVAHANGEVATVAYINPLIMSGEVNGRTYRTRPDMLMAAVDLVRRVREYAGRVRLIGDTLPVALLGKPEAYLQEVCRRLAPNELPPGDGAADKE